MKTKITWILPVLFLASCIISGKNDDLLDPVTGKSTLRDPGDGTITDSATGLVWKKCSQGQTTDTLCSGTPTGVQYCNANDNTCNGGSNTGTLNGAGTSAAYTSCNDLNASSYAGKTTWRVPTLDELKTINTNTVTEESVFKIFFPNTGRADYYVSASSLSATQFAAATFLGQTLLFTKTTGIYYLRCVAQ